MTMDPENQSQSAQHHLIKGQILDQPARELIPEIKRILKGKNKRFAAGEYIRIAVASVGSLGYATLLWYEPRPYARAGLAIALVCFPLIAITANRLGRKRRVKQAWLPVMSFLRSERERLDAEIRLRHLTLWLYAIPILAVGMSFLPAEVTLTKWLVYLCMILVWGGILLVLQKREIRKLSALRAKAAEHLHSIEHVEDEENYP
jgi:hypothetical protein